MPRTNPDDSQQEREYTMQKVGTRVLKKRDSNNDTSALMSASGHRGATYYSVSCI